MSRMRRFSAFVLVAFVAALAACVLSAAPAAAQVVRAFTTRYSINAPGDIAMIGNTLMTCSGNGQCVNAQGGSGNTNNIDDNDFNMVYVDMDGDASTVSSSSANFALPAGATVLWAGLYWGGESTVSTRNTCKFATPVAGYTAITATQTDLSGNRYSSFRDVTTLVQAGGTGTYLVGNVLSSPGNSDVYAGWGLVIVYRDATLPNRNLVVNDGFALVQNTSTVTYTVGGFVTPPAGPVQTRLGVISYEGDIGYTGDSFRLNGTTLSDAVNPATNFFNSTISRFGAHVTTKNPNYVNQLGFDIDMLTANGILANGATSATISLITNGDTYYPAVVSFATDLYAPVLEGNSFQKSVTDLNGAPARPGDVLEYTVTMRNTGQDNSINTTLRDTLAANLTYVPGSLSIVNGPNAGTKTDGAGDDQAEYVAGPRTLVVRLGTGANAFAGGTISVGVQTIVRFRATVTSPVPNGTIVTNQGGLAFNAAQLGTAFNTRSDADSVAAGFQPTSTTISAPLLSGTVFEDVNYGGGAGRTLAAAAGVVRPNVRVELYNASGTYLTFTTTDAAGMYAFSGFGPGNYTVRVASTTVLSSRSGAGPSLLPVQTFRTVASTGTAVADPARVGGETPALADAGTNVSSQTLAALTTATTTPQSITPLTLGTNDITGMDFGYNFDTIVNANDSGQGSLRAWLTNAASMSNAGLTQVGQTAGVEVSIFMVSDGLAHPGLRAGLANLLTGGVVRVVAQSLFSPMSDANTRLDGATQTANVGDTNAGTLGSSGTVGAAGLALASVARPEVEIVDGASLARGVELLATGSSVSSVAIYGFGTVLNDNNHADIKVGSAATGAVLENLVLGTPATSFADPGAAARSVGDHVRVGSASGGILRNSLLGYGQSAGVSLVTSANGWQVTGNQIVSNGLGSATADGITIASSTTATIRGNLVRANAGMGVDALTSAGTNTIEQNSIARNGVGIGGAPSETPGVGLGGTGSIVDRNELSENFGAGVLVAVAANANTITKNSIWGNGTLAATGGGAASGQVGIDLLKTGDDATRGTTPFRTLNDAGDVDTGANGVLNFPVLSTAVVSNGSFTVSGWARPGSTIELFVAETDPSGFGEGRTWVVTLVEGSASDLDATSSNYTGLINGVNQGTDTTNRFRFTLAAPVGVAPGVELTATAMIAASGTSEFSGRVTVSGGVSVSVSGYAYRDGNHDSGKDPGEDGTAQTIWVKLFSEPLPQTAQQVVAADPATGLYTFNFVASGTYSIVLDNNNDPDDATPVYPAGWLGVEAGTGIRAGTVVGATDLANQNFGLWNGSRVDGRVVRDDGAGGGVANDGVAQAGEAAVTGVRVRLTAPACAGSMCDSVLTDGAGAFRLWLAAAAAGAGVGVSEVNPPAWLSTGGGTGTTGGAYVRTTDAVTFTAVAGTAYSGVLFGDVPPNAFAAGGTASVADGAAALYGHTFTAGSAGAVTFGSSQVTTPVLPGWAVQLYRDTNCNTVLDAGEPLVTAPVTVVAGQNVCLIARHISPVGAPAGAQAQATLTASFVYTGAAPALSAVASLVDLTTVLASGGGLQLAKSVSASTARPGDYLDYTITYTNLASTPLTTIVIQDATPAFTIFDSAGCGTLGTGLTGCGVTTQPAVGAAGAVKWTLAGALAPGATGSVTYRVKVQ